MDASLLTVAIIVAALVIRTAVNETRSPGSARQEWAFVTGGVAMLSGAVTASAWAPRAGTTRDTTRLRGRDRRDRVGPRDQERESEQQPEDVGGRWGRAEYRLRRRRPDQCGRERHFEGDIHQQQGVGEQADPPQ